MTISNNFSKNLVGRSLHPKEEILRNAVIYAKEKVMKNPNNFRKLLENEVNAAGQRPIRADIVTEKAFMEYLKKSEINVKIFSEESGVKVIGDANNLDLVVLIDPLDGSKNFMKNIPVGCISIAYTFNADATSLKDLDHGVIIDLYSNECYYAAKGEGAWFNGKPIEIDSFNGNSKKSKINYYTYTEKIKRFFNEFKGQYEPYSLGSVAWELAMVSNSRTDAFVDLRGKVKAHDFAAGKIIIEEADGQFSFLDNTKEKNIMLDTFQEGYRILATQDKELHESIEYDINSILNGDNETA
jgi:myo-inositol-1(or 4)-monophosphatase